MKILVAEDDFVFKQMLAFILEKEGHTPLLARDGEEAWNLFEKEEVSMVLTDWMMPKMDGIALCRKIREVEHNSYTYIIFLTAKDLKSDCVKGLDAGADDYMIKPVDPEELEARIRCGQRIIELEDRMRQSQAQLLQSEKMAAIGQLSAGVAHEINNPTGFVSSNLKTLSEYQKDLGELLERYRGLSRKVADEATAVIPAALVEEARKIIEMESEKDLDFILEDTADLIVESREGIERIKKIVLDLKEFSHPGDNRLKYTDINAGIESTLNVVWNELKYKAKVRKDLGQIPKVKCFPQKLNQVFMNLLVNAAQAMETEGEINIRTREKEGFVEIEISDTGCGIPEENLTRIFDPFFTTKEVGKGTGLGLNVVYNIVKEHKGTIDVESKVGEGTTFRIRIPATQKPGECDDPEVQPLAFTGG